MKTLLPLLSALVLGGLAAAQDVSAGYTRSFGGSFAGGSFGTDASLSIEDGRGDALSAMHTPSEGFGLAGGSNASARVTLFWQNIEAFRFGVNGHLTDTGDRSFAPDHELTGLVRVAGRTLYSASAETEISVTRSFGPYDIFARNLSATWWLGPVPLTVSANAGSAAEATLSLAADVPEHRVTLTATPHAWQYGWASAGIGWAGFSAGVNATLNLANTTLAMPLVADLEDGFSGALTLSMTPISIYLRLYAAVNLWFWHDAWYLTVYSWSAGAWSRTLQLF